MAALVAALQNVSCVGNAPAERRPNDHIYAYAYAHAYQASVPEYILYVGEGEGQARQAVVQSQCKA